MKRSSPKLRVVLAVAAVLVLLLLGGRVTQRDGVQVEPRDLFATPFDAERLQELFPAAVIRVAEASSEGESVRALEVVRGNRPVLAVRSATGRTISSVEVLAGAAVSGASDWHGRRYDEAFAAGTEPACSPGMEEASGRVVCRAPRAEWMRLVFGGPWSGPDGELPPRAILRRWTVERVVMWPPDSGEE